MPARAGHPSRAVYVSLFPACQPFFVAPPSIPLSVPLDIPPLRCCFVDYICVCAGVGAVGSGGGGDGDVWIVVVVVSVVGVARVLVLVLHVSVFLLSFSLRVVIVNAGVIFAVSRSDDGAVFAAFCLLLTNVPL